MKIAISADSAIDLTEELKQKYDIKTLPFTVLLGNDVKKDGEFSTDELLNFAEKNKTLPKTSAINESEFGEHFDKLLCEYDAVVHFSLSSGLSSACNNAIAAAKDRKNVYVVDSLSLSTGIALLAVYGRELADSGKMAEEIYKACVKRVPFVQASCELKRIDFLYRGGRCSALMYLGANLLKIRPQIVCKEGKMVAGKKYRGNYAHVVDKYVLNTLEEFNTPDFTRAFITYTTADTDIIERVKLILKGRGFKDIEVTRAGATITGYTGEDCLGIAYFNDGDVNRRV